MRIKTMLILLLPVILAGCGDDDAVPGSKLNHTGEKWRIVSVDYNIVDMNLSDPTQWVRTGTAKDAGAFYFNGNEGSFDILIKNDRQEDYFGYTASDTDITIIQIDQSISPRKFSQSVIAISGSKSGATMNLSGTITKQSLPAQYVFTGTFILQKE